MAFLATTIQRSLLTWPRCTTCPDQMLCAGEGLDSDGTDILAPMLYEMNIYVGAMCVWLGYDAASVIQDFIAQGELRTR